MQEQLEKDLKQAMLAGDKLKTETLRGLKSAIHNETIAQGSQSEGLSDEQIQKVLVREAKKRQEAAELYKHGGNDERATAELAEKTIIEAYLPEPVSEEAIATAVDEAIKATGASSAADMGKVIGAVRGKLGASADGAVVARIVKEKLQ